jgi:hypothetical protein
MAYTSNRELDTLRKKFRRVLLNGPPNSGKTTSLRTFPGPVVGLHYPKEKGTSALPLTTLDGHAITGFIPDDIDVTKPQDWTAIYTEMRKQTVDIIAGKHGQVRTFFGDGLHKAYQIVLAAVTNGRNFTGEEFEPRMYSTAHARFWEYLDLILSSPVEYAVLTCWNEPEQDNKLDQSSDGKKKFHNMPALPGQAAMKVMGEFTIVLSAGIEGFGAGAKYFWQVQPGGYNWGAGMKLPIEVMQKLKLGREVEQNFTKLNEQITKAIDEVHAQANTPKEVK